MTDTKSLPIFNQLQRYATNTSVQLGDLSPEAFNTLNQFFDSLRDEQETAGDDPADFIQWASTDFRLWLVDEIRTYLTENVD